MPLQLELRAKTSEHKRAEGECKKLNTAINSKQGEVAKAEKTASTLQSSIGKVAKDFDPTQALRMTDVVCN